MRNLYAAILSGLLAFAPGSVAAQSPFAARIMINNAAISGYEIDQRILFLEALQTPGDLEEQAEEVLIEDRLGEIAARIAGIRVTVDEINAGVEEFAGRFGLTPDQFMVEMQNRGIELETIRDFVGSGLAWRQVVQQRFGPRAAVTEEEIDAALSLSSAGSGISVLMSELVLPLSPGIENQARQLVEDIRRNTKSADDFENFVMAYSASPSVQNRGRLEWQSIGQFPPHISTMLLTMSPGQVSEMVELPGALALFFMRGFREERAVKASAAAIDYATLLLPGAADGSAAAAAAELDARTDTCHDLQTLGAKFGPERFRRETTAAARISRDIAAELSRLDMGEMSANLRGGPATDGLLVVMLCNRTFDLPEGERDQLRQILFTQRLEALANGYMQELKADAIITRK